MIIFVNYIYECVHAALFLHLIKKKILCFIDYYIIIDIGRFQKLNMYSIFYDVINLIGLKTNKRIDSTEIELKN